MSELLAPAQQPLLVVGKSVPRADALEKVTGQARFTGDLTLPGMLYGKVLRSPVPHARIRRVDVSAAVAMQGVVAVLTGADLSGLRPFYGHGARDRPVIAMEKVRFVGDPVAAVAAESEAIAADALERIEVEYEELPAACDVFTALAADASLINESGREVGKNVCSRAFVEAGDVEAAFRTAALVLSDEFRFQSVYQYAMEPHTVLARWEGGRLSVWSSAQHPFLVRNDLAAIFGLPLTEVTVTSPFLGGGFGSKSYTKYEPLVAALARKAQRPVLVEFSVEEAFHTNRRHAAVVRLKSGVAADGRLVAVAATAWLDTGAYADNGPTVAAGMLPKLLGLYRCPSYRLEGLAVYTNLPPAGSYRAPGGPQANWAVESQMDDIAARLGLDPWEVRRRNLLDRGERLMPDKKPMDADLRGNLERLAERAAAFRPAARSEDHRLRGAGQAMATTTPGAGSVAVALVRLCSDGTLLVHAGATEMGQGARTVLAQLAAEELGLPVTQVRVTELSTDTVPFNRSTGASRSTTVLGTAVVAACTDLREQVGRACAVQLETNARDLRFADGGVSAPSGERLLLGEVVCRMFGMQGGELIGRGYSGPGLGDGRLDHTPLFWEVAMGHAEVAVDPETGLLSLERYVSLGDVGLAVNPRLVEGQELGAVMQGIGHTLFEEIVYRNGVTINANLVDYRVPLAPDFPDRFESILVENRDGPGPHGLKGAGEAALVPVAAAIGNAIRQATGVRVRELPLTPERVWRALGKQGPGRQPPG